MKKTFALLALAVVAAVPTVAVAQNAPVATAGKMLFDSEGKRVAAVYRVSPDGSAQVMLSGKLVTVPAATLSVDGGKVVTSLTRAQIASTR